MKCECLDEIKGEGLGSSLSLLFGFYHVRLKLPLKLFDEVFVGSSASFPCCVPVTFQLKFN